MSYLSSHFDDVDKCINSGLTSKDLMNRILRSRHDHTTLESVLRVIDVHLDSNYLAEIREKLVSKFEDDELLSLTLKSNKNTIDYIKQTIEVDVLINLLEGRAIFKDGKSIEQFSREIIEIFESVYPLKRNLLKAS
jgi:hypothetical protein